MSSAPIGSGPRTPLDNTPEVDPAHAVHLRTRRFQGRRGRTGVAPQQPGPIRDIRQGYSTTYSGRP